MSHHLTVDLDTTGSIAQMLGVPLHRVNYVLNSRRYIMPSARVGRLRVYDADAVACIRHELSGIDARTRSEAPP